MHATNLCICCAVVLGLGFVRVVSALRPGDKDDFGCGRISNEPSGTRQMGTQNDEDVQEMLGITATRQTTVVVAHPKITPAPSLLRRKLGSNHWDLIHKGIQGQKRDATSCPADYQLCPQSLKGGCCPNDRVCGESSCLPASAGPASACGMSGYVACGIDDGGGCCPSNYVCGNNGCTPSAGVSVTQTCGTDSYLCPASFDYGCCKSGMACGLSSCYSTAIVSYTLTETLTTTDANSNAQTITTIIATASTPVVPTAVLTLESGVIPKASSAPSAIPKTKASGTSSGGGLTTPQLGGIIGGAVAILLVVLIVAFIIVKRLNKAIEVAATSKASSSGQRSRRSHPRPLDVDAMSVDPLMMTPSEVSETPRVPSVPSHASVVPSSAHEADSSPIWRSPFSPRSPPHTKYPRGYNAVASSDSAYSASSSGNRNPSLESSPPLHHNPNAGYFDIPPQGYYDRRSPTSHISPSSQRRPSQHGRNWSNASDQSAVSQSSSQMAELEAGADGDRRSGVQRVMQGMGLGRMLSRRLSRRQSEPIRRSQQPPVLTGGPQRADWSPPAVMGGGALGHIPEAGESRIGLDMQEVDLGTTGLSNAQLREISLLEQQQQNAAEMREGQRYG